MKIMRYQKYSLSCSRGNIVCASCLIIFIVESRVWIVLGASMYSLQVQWKTIKP